MKSEISATAACLAQHDEAIRPGGFASYIGQERVAANIRLFVAAALQRGEQLDHVLLHGPPGLGKTSLALVIAAEAGSRLVSSSGPAIEKPGDLAAILLGLESGDTLFIDEIHRLPRVAEEILYSALEDFRVDIIIGSGSEARAMSIDLPKFTLIGATTRFGALSAPLRDRFGIIERLNFYSELELSKIIVRSAGIYKITLADGAASELGRRSRGTPRIANRLLRRVRDFADVRGGGVTGELVAEALEQLEIDTLGLDASDRGYLGLLCGRFAGRPAGLATIAAAINEDQQTIEDVLEPYLLQLGLIERTPRGRLATPLALRLYGQEC